MEAFSYLLSLDSLGPWAVEFPPDFAGRVYPFDRTKLDLPTRAAESFVRDEAIAIAQLAGAHVLRDVARAFLDGARAPSNSHERLLANSARVRRRIAAGAGEDFDLAALESMHRDLFGGTHLEDEGLIGRLRSGDTPPRDDEAASSHGLGVACPEEWVSALFAVLNARSGVPPFVHPIAKASLIHGTFQIAAPLAFGNATIARLLLLRQLLRDGYHVLEKWSLSSAFLFAPDRVTLAMESAQQTRSVAPLVECGLDVLHRARMLAARKTAATSDESSTSNPV